MTIGLTKKLAPTIGRDAWELRQAFGDTMEITAVRDGNTALGYSWKHGPAQCWMAVIGDAPCKMSMPLPPANGADNLQDTEAENG